MLGLLWRTIEWTVDFVFQSLGPPHAWVAQYFQLSVLFRRTKKTGWKRPVLILHFVGIETTSESGAYRTMEKPVPAIGPAFKRSIPVEGDENVHPAFNYQGRRASWIHLPMVRAHLYRAFGREAW